MSYSPSQLWGVAPWGTNRTSPTPASSDSTRSTPPAPQLGLMSAGLVSDPRAHGTGRLSLAPAVISALPAWGGGDPSSVRGASRCVLLGSCTCLPVQIDPEAARLPLPMGSLPSPGGLCHTEVPQRLRGEISHCNAPGSASSTPGQRMQTLFCVFDFYFYYLLLYFYCTLSSTGNFRLSGGRFYWWRDVLQQGGDKEKRARCVQGIFPPRCLASRTRQTWPWGAGAAESPGQAGTGGCSQGASFPQPRSPGSRGTARSRAGCVSLQRPLPPARRDGGVVTRDLGVSRY